MLTLLALMAQTATLDADPYVAARTCAVATIRTIEGNDLGFVDNARFMFYTLHAARARPEGKPMLDRLGEVMTETLPEVAKGDAAGVIAQCEKRFPRPARVTAANLPKNPLDRDIMCVAVLGLLQGSAQSVREDHPDDPWLDRVRTPMTTIMARMTDEAMARAGLGDDAAIGAAFERQIRASLDLGDPLAVGRACGVEGG